MAAYLVVMRLAIGQSGLFKVALSEEGPLAARARKVLHVPIFACQRCKPYIVLIVQSVLGLSGAVESALDF